MKLVLVSDLHAQSKTLDYLSQILKQEKPAGVIFSGDISMNENTDFLEKIFAVLRQENIRGYMICGNADEGAGRRMIDQSEFSINQTCKDGICGLCDHEEMLQNPAAIRGKIFVSHRPPLASALSKKLPGAPAFHISGHLHTRSSARQYPAVFMIQVPTLQSGAYGVFNPDAKEVVFKHL